MTLTQTNPPASNYTCTDIKKDNVCELQKGAEGQDHHTYLESCPSYQQCNFREGAEGQCFGNRNPLNLDLVKYNSYRGGACRTDDDCIYRAAAGNPSCTGGKCVETPIPEKGDVCRSNDACSIGKYCGPLDGKNQCLDRKSAGADCKSDDECHNDSLCIPSLTESKNICTKYLTLQKDNEIKIQINDVNQYRYLCQSTYLEKKLDDKQQPAQYYSCQALTNKDNKPEVCDPKAKEGTITCHYNEGERKFPLTDCKQSYGTNPGKFYCPFGSVSNTNLKAYTDDLAKIIAASAAGCHPSENRLEYCSEHLAKNWELRRTVNPIKVNKHKAENPQYYVDAQTCVADVVFGNQQRFRDDPPRAVRHMKCPKYTCKDADNKEEFEHCANTTNPFNINGDGAAVVVGKCKSGKSCKYNRDEALLNYVFNTPCAEVEFGKEDKKPERNSRFPGEKCYTDTDCTLLKYNSTKPEKNSEKRCIDGKCWGQKENELCEAHYDCNVGFFCNGIWCEKQQPEKAFCVDDFSCMNNLFCLNNTCTAAYSQKNGTFIGDLGNPLLCENGDVTSDNRCSILDYAPSHTVETDGSVKCDVGTFCNYTTGLLDEQGDALPLVPKPCQCGYNKDGQGYCPYPYARKPADFQSLVKLEAKKLDNKCHVYRKQTTHRGEGEEQPPACYEVLTAADNESNSNLLMKTSNAHLYFGSLDKCINLVLSSVSLQFTSFLLLIFIALLI